MNSNIAATPKENAHTRLSALFKLTFTHPPHPLSSAVTWHGNTPSSPAQGASARENDFPPLHVRIRRPFTFTSNTIQQILGDNFSEDGGVEG